MIIFLNSSSAPGAGAPSNVPQLTYKQLEELINKVNTGLNLGRLLCFIMLHSISLQSDPFTEIVEFYRIFSASKKQYCSPTGRRW